jgi:transposase-like protein
VKEVFMSEVKRWSAKRKQEVVLLILRGESLDALSRETGVPAGDLYTWRDEFLEAGQARLFELTVQDVKQRNRDYSQDAILEAIDEALANG